MLILENKRLAPLFAHYLGLLSSDKSIMMELSQQITDYDILNTLIYTEPVLREAADYFYYKPRLKSIYTEKILRQANSTNYSSLGQDVENGLKGIQFLRIFPVFSASANETNTKSMSTYLKNARQSFYVVNKFESIISVSYTHLTLPTKRIV